MKQPVSVLVVDDSAVVRQVVGAMVTADPRLRLLGTAPNPLVAAERMRAAWPDVIVLDIEMPHMDGLTFLRKLMAQRPTPVVICSTLTEAGAATTLDALAAGAVATVPKPKFGLKAYLQDAAADLVSVILAAARANLRVLAPPAPARLSADAVLAAPKSQAPAAGATGRVVVLGASTGGTQALEQVLTALPPSAPPVAVVQHMPEQFTALFAQRLDQLCQVRVLEARHLQPMMKGQVLIAPGGKHLLLRRQGNGHVVEVVNGPLVNRHRPAVDVLFRSAAKCAGANALGVIMTGMGDDGAAGLLEMRRAGAFTLAQDEASCVVYGMPGAAVRRGAVMASLPLAGLAHAILTGGHAETAGAT
jgi:two-component system chemotaxis response regulator CheB